MTKTKTAKTDTPREIPREPTLLYLISPLEVGGGFPDRLARALDAGPVAAFQFRVRDIDQHEAARLAEPLQRICADREVTFIVESSVGLAKRLGADGVHLGQDDASVEEAREALGRDAQIGVSCLDSRHLAMDAGEAGADYVSFGAFYPTTSVVTTHQAGTDLLEWWQAIFELPCVAIGGVTPDNCGDLVRAGADFIATLSAVWSGDEAAAVKAFYAAISAAQA